MNHIYNCIIYNITSATKHTYNYLLQLSFYGKLRTFDHLKKEKEKEN